jgi:hypothetical protein
VLPLEARHSSSEPHAQAHGRAPPPQVAEPRAKTTLFA